MNFMNISDALEITKITIEENNSVNQIKIDDYILNNVTTYIIKAIRIDKYFDLTKTLCTDKIRNTEEFKVLFNTYFNYLYTTGKYTTYNTVITIINHVIKNIKYTKKIDVMRKLFELDGYKRCTKFALRRKNAFDYHEKSIFSLMFNNCDDSLSRTSKYHIEKLYIQRFRYIYEILTYNNDGECHVNIYNYLADIIISNAGHLHEMPDSDRLSNISLIICIYDILIMLFSRDYIDKTYYLMDSNYKIHDELINKFWICQYIVGQLYVRFINSIKSSVKYHKSLLIDNPLTIYEKKSNENNVTIIQQHNKAMEHYTTMHSLLYNDIIIRLICHNMFFLNNKNDHSSKLKLYYTDIVTYVSEYCVKSFDELNHKKDGKYNYEYIFDLENDMSLTLLDKYIDFLIEFINVNNSVRTIGVMLILKDKIDVFKFLELYQEYDKINNILMKYSELIDICVEKYYVSTDLSQLDMLYLRLLAFNLTHDYVSYISKQNNINNIDCVNDSINSKLVEKCNNYVLNSIDNITNIFDIILSLFKDSTLIIDVITEKYVIKFITRMISWCSVILQAISSNINYGSYLCKCVLMFDTYINYDMEIHPLINENMNNLYEEINYHKKGLSIVMINSLEHLLKNYVVNKIKIAEDVEDSILSLIDYDTSKLNIIDNDDYDNVTDSITFNTVYDPIYLPIGNANSMLIDRSTYEVLKYKKINPFNRLELDDNEIMEFNQREEIVEKRNLVLEKIVL